MRIYLVYKSFLHFCSYTRVWGGGAEGCSFLLQGGLWVAGVGSPRPCPAVRPWVPRWRAGSRGCSASPGWRVCWETAALPGEPSPRPSGPRGACCSAGPPSRRRQWPVLRRLFPQRCRQGAGALQPGHSSSAAWGSAETSADRPGKKVNCRHSKSPVQCGERPFSKKLLTK